MIEAYLIHLLILVGIYFILALGLQITVGLSGLLNLSHIAFYAIGAYTSVLLEQAGMPFILSFLLGGLAAFLAGLIFTFFIHRLKGDYVALTTLGFTFVTYTILLNWVSLTKGPFGIANIQKPVFLGISIVKPWKFLVFVILLSILFSLLYWFIKKSYFGLTLQAIRDNELAIKSMGRNTLLFKACGLGFAGFFAGIAGSLYAHYITYIDPSSFTFLQLVPIFIIIIIAGLTSLQGTMLATLIIILLPEPLRFIGFPSSIIGPMRQIIYVIILFIILYLKPKGFFGKIEL